MSNITETLDIEGEYEYSVDDYLLFIRVPIHWQLSQEDDGELIMPDTSADTDETLEDTLPVVCWNAHFWDRDEMFEYWEAWFDYDFVVAEWYCVGIDGSGDMEVEDGYMRVLGF